MPKQGSLDFLIGKYRCSKRDDFRQIINKYSDSTPHYLLKEAADAFEKMSAAASEDKIDLKIISGFRSFARQKYIFEEKYLGHRLVDSKNLLLAYPKDHLKRIKIILNYSAIPGTSRHHWGTDLDINSLDNSYFESEKGVQVYKWLQNNAKKFGFFQPYTSDIKGGYKEEKWHWSYAPLSVKFLNNFRELVKYDDIKGFQGDKYLPGDFFDNYVFNIKGPPDE